MDSSPVSLNERAEERLRHLQQLAERAAKAHRTHHTKSTRKLLTNVEGNAKNSIRLLQTWKTDFGNGEITKDQQLLELTNSVLENLRHWIDDAEDALISRLLFRKLFLLGFITSKRLVWWCCRLHSANSIAERTLKNGSPQP